MCCDSNFVCEHDDDNFVFYIFFNSVSVLMRQFKGDNERLCIMKCFTEILTRLHTCTEWSVSSLFKYNIRQFSCTNSVTITMPSLYQSVSPQHRIYIIAPDTILFSF